MTRFVAIVLTLIGVVLSILVILPYFLPVDAYKDQLGAAVEDRTDRKLEIKGGLSLSLFPSVKLTATDVQIANVPGGEAPAFVSLDALTVSIKVLPLLSGRVEVDRFILTNPRIALEIDKAGHPNWTDDRPPKVAKASKRRAKPAANPAPVDDEAPTGGDVTITDVSLGVVKLVDGAVTFVDHRTGLRRAADHINVAVHLPEITEPFSIDGNLIWSGQKVVVTLDGDRAAALFGDGDTKLHLSLRAPRIDLGFEGALTGARERALAGRVEAKTPSLRDLMAWLDLAALQPGPGFGALALTGEIEAGGNRAALRQAVITLDGAEARGDVSIDMTSRVPKIAGALTLGALDLTPYLAPRGDNGAKGADAKGASPVAAPREAADWSDAPIDASALARLDLDLNVTLEGLKADALTIGPSVVAIEAVAGKVRAIVKRMALYEGRGTAQVTLDGSGPAPGLGLALALDLDGVAVEPFLRDAVQVDRISGRGAVNLDLTAHGRSERALIGALNGRGRIAFRDGALAGIDLGAMIRNVGAAFGADGAGQKTEYSDLGATVQIVDGVARNEDLDLKAPLFRVEGKGAVDLPRRQIDYRLTPRLVASLQGQGATGQAAGLTVPVLITGSLDHPAFRPDLEGLVTRNLGDPAKLFGKLGGGKAAEDGQKPKPADLIKGLLGR